MASQPRTVSPGATSQRESDPKLKVCLSRRLRDSNANINNLQSLKRDMAQCVLTKRGLPTIQTAHIVPNKVNRTSNDYLIKENCWAWLDTFWGEDRVVKLKAQLLTGGMVGTEQVANLITLDMQAHEYWDRTHFAFRPLWINESKTEMHLAFHWLPFVKDGPFEIPKRTECVPTEVHIFDDPYYRPIMGPGKNNILFHTQTLKPILSGYVFRITTDNPKARPLPSMELLQLKWHLSRIAAMQGSGEDEDRDNDSDRDSISVRTGPRTPSRGRNVSRENIPPSRSPTPSLTLSKIMSLALESDVHPSHLVEE